MLLNIQIFTQQYAAKHSNIYFRLDHAQQLLFTSPLPLGPQTTENMYCHGPHTADNFTSLWNTHKKRLFTSPWTTNNRDCLLPIGPRKEKTVYFFLDRTQQRLFTSPWTTHNRDYFPPLGPHTNRD